MMPDARFRRLMAIAWRESRTARRRLLLYMSSISLGVAALVAIDSFTENVSASVQEQSRALLGGDVALSARAAYSRNTTLLLDSLARTGTGVSRVTTFASMGLVPRSGATRLVQVRAVTHNYPFYGEITTRPDSAWRRMSSGRVAIVDPALLVSLDARIGDTLMLGTARFEIIAAIRNVPGDVGMSAAIGPRVFIPDAYLRETGLLIFGSRAEYDALLRMPPGLSPARFAARFNQRFATDTPRVRLRTVAENEMNLTQAIDQLGSFLGIVGLVALLLGGIGVASGVHAFVMRKIDTVAVLRCLGATSGQVLLIYVLQAAAMGFAGALAGAAFGVAVQGWLGDAPYVLMKHIGYHPQPGVDERRRGVAAHLDFSLVTLTLQDDVGGLEVQRPSGEWVAVPPVRGAWLVNVGELLQFVTGGRLLATPHRVVNPSASRSRFSIPVFLNPSLPTRLWRARPPVPRAPPRGEHVHAVLSADDLERAWLCFGEEEWRRKGENVWCAQCKGALSRPGAREFSAVTSNS